MEIRPSIDDASARHAAAGAGNPASRMIGFMGVQANSRAAAHTAAGRDAQLREMSREFEGLLIGVLMSSMRETIQDDPMFGGGSAEKTFQSMADAETSRNMAQRGGFGIADSLYRQLAQQQHAAELKAKLAASEGGAS